MPSNFPGPYVVEVDYNVDQIIHHLTWNVTCDVDPPPGENPANIYLVNRGGATTLIAAAISTYLSSIAPLYHTSTTFGTATLWKITPLTNIRTYITSFGVGVPGTSAAVYNPAQQLTLTYRTQEGGIMRQTFMEPSYVSNLREPLSGVANTAIQAMRDNTLAGTNVLLARDTSYPIAPLNVSSGQNEVIFRKRFRA